MPLTIVTDRLITVSKRENLKLVAEPFGARPVYALESVHEVLVATSQQQLRKAGAICGVEPNRVRAHLLGDTIEPLVGGVERVPPGATLLVEQGRVRVEPSPRLAAEDLSERRNRQSLVTELTDRIGDAVDRMVGDGKPALSLGIGVDSAVLLALVEGRDPVTWTLVSGPLDPDLLNTVRLAKHFGAEHNIFEARENELPDLFEEAVLAAETVLWNPRSVAFHKLAVAMKKAGHPVVLTGLGADELLMGHPTMLMSDGGPPPIARRFEDDRRLIRRLLDEQWLVGDPAPRPAMGVPEARDLMIRTTLPHDAMPLGGRGTLMPGFEFVMPYLDESVAKFALGLQTNDLIMQSADGLPGLGKSLLRDAWDGIIPDAIRMRPRQMRLSPPAGGDKAAHKLWAQLYEGVLSEDALRDLRVVDRLKVRRLVGAHASKNDYKHPGFGVMDRVLMRLSSLVILQKALS